MHKMQNLVRIFIFGCAKNENADKKQSFVFLVVFVHSFSIFDYTEEFVHWLVQGIFEPIELHQS